MNVVKCLNNHFFDKDTYEECPICGNTADVPDTSGKKIKNNKSVFTKFFKKNNKIEQNEECLEIPRDESETNPISKCAVGVKETRPEFEHHSIEIEKGKTLDFWQDVALTENQINGNDDEKNDYLPSTSNEEKEESLKDIIEKASAISSGKTMSYFNAMNNQKNSIETTVEPIVGWLVCINGLHLGESFNIFAGINSIGRIESNKISICKDNSVSREKHAFITYEPKKRKFYIKPGESSGLTYLNDEYITEACELNDKDIIELGSTKLLFVPLCGSIFTWEDYINKEK